jgi:hypothetical protein
MKFDEERSPSTIFGTFDDETWPLEACYTFLEHDVTHTCGFGGVILMC